jgi:transposase
VSRPKASGDGGQPWNYAGIDVSLELSSVCVVDGQGKIMKEAKVASEPEALVCFFKELGFPVKLVRP